MAVWPPPRVLGALADLPRPVLESAHWSTRDQWHVTLRFFGELSSSEAERASEILAACGARADSPITAAGGPATRLLGPRLLVWPVEGLSALAGAVEAATAGLGEPVPARRFTGHITIARARGGSDLRPHRQLLVHPLSSTWPVTYFSLVRSQLNPKGARYNELARFVLGAGTAGAREPV